MNWRIPNEAITGLPSEQDRMELGRGFAGCIQEPDTWEPILPRQPEPWLPKYGKRREPYTSYVYTDGLHPQQIAQGLQQTPHGPELVIVGYA